MIYTADEDAMKEYSAIIQQVAYLDFQRNQLIERLKAWEDAHKVEDVPGNEEAPEQ